MKKLMVVGAGMLLATAVAYAQVDTTSTQQSSRPQQSTPQVTPQQQDESQNYSKDQIDSKHMVRVQPSDVPKTLKRTLEAPEYQGWENAALYRDKRNNNYILQIQNGGKMRTHRFGPDGKPIGDY